MSQVCLQLPWSTFLIPGPTQLAQRGVPTDRLHVLPLAINVAAYAPGVVAAAALPLPSRCEFTVLALAEGRWGGGADAAITAFTRAFGQAGSTDYSACIAVLDVGRAAPFEVFRAQALASAAAEQLPRDMYDNIVVAHADTTRDDASMPRLLAAADLVLLTARDGVVGTAAMEAMAAGKVRGF
jgi:hypothetical protein